MNNNSNSIPTVIAVDVGYGQVKYLTGQKKGQFRSIYSCCEHENTLTIEVEGKEPLSFLYGEESPHGGRLFSVENQRLFSTPGLILISAALWESGVEGEVTLATGIPFDLYASEKDHAAAFWNGRRITLTRNGAKRIIHIVRTDVYQQGYAALYAAMHEPSFQGNLPAYSDLVAMIDVGQRLTNVVLATVKPAFSLKTASSFTMVRGMNDAEFKIRKEITSHYNLLGINLIPHDFISLFLEEGKIDYLDEIADFTKRREEILKYVSKRISQEIKSYWQSQETRVGLFYLAGGGMKYLKDYFTKYFENAVVYETETLAAQYANVKGYYLMAQEQQELSQ